ALRRIPPTWDPHGDRTIAAANLAQLRQRPDEVLVLLEAMSPEVIDDRDHLRIAKTHILRGQAHQALGDTALARSEYIEARATLQKAAAHRTDAHRIHAILAVVHARLGQKDLALRETKLASDAALGDAVEWSDYLVSAAESYASLGESDAALELLAQLIDLPGLLSVHHLRMEPRWDPLRRDPRFERLLNTRSHTVLNGRPTATSHSQ
ncbi:MAG TPA: hypothetical protein VFI96_05200, partial [Longimicrobiaceae bacterium]|nr:hypothetical protein [Longimicrobiaceae bacterium]